MQVTLWLLQTEIDLRARKLRAALPEAQRNGFTDPRVLRVRAEEYESLRDWLQLMTLAHGIGDYEQAAASSMGLPDMREVAEVVRALEDLRDGRLLCYELTASPQLAGFLAAALRLQFGAPTGAGRT